ncbi:MAG: hypothetical protein WCI18_11390 [Pseudomonadota bacterium]
MAFRLFKIILITLFFVSCTTVRRKYAEVTDRVYKPALKYDLQGTPGFQAFLTVPVANQVTSVYLESRVPVFAGREYLVGGFSGPLNYSKLANRSRLELKKLPPLMRFDIWKGSKDFPTWGGARSSKGVEVSEMDILAAVALVPGKFDSIDSLGPSGITVPFFSTDLAALLAWLHYQQGRLPQPVAGKCESGFYTSRFALDQNLAGGKISRILYGEEMEKVRKSFDCQGLMEAALFHQVIVFYIGEQKKSLLMERDGKNYIIHGYDLTWTKEKSGYTMANMKLKVLSYRGEGEFTYKYRMDLNSKGAMEQGVWVAGEAPSVIWKPDEATHEGLFNDVMTLVKEAGKSTPVTP